MNSCESDKEDYIQKVDFNTKESTEEMRKSSPENFNKLTQLISDTKQKHRSKLGLVSGLRVSRTPSTLKSVLLGLEIENTVKETVKFLKWDTPFEKVDAHSNIFEVKVLDLNGKSLNHSGVSASRGNPEEHDYQTLRPNESIYSEVNIAHNYNFEVGKTYKIRYSGSHDGDVPPSNWVLVKIHSSR